MSTTFIIIKVGVYRHDIWGPFVAAKIADEKAQQLAEEETDAWHSFEVHRLEGHIEDDNLSSGTLISSYTKTLED